MYLLYSALLAAGLALSSPWWLLKMLRQGKYRAGLRERLGRVPTRIQGPTPTIWIHAVSVGEVLAISALAEEMRTHQPRRVVVSTTTAAGQELARRKFGEQNVFYFPLDFAFAIRPYLRALRPDLVVLAETEFWPNFLRLVRRSGARIAVVNARISDRSLPRYQRVRALMRPVLAGIDLFQAQSEEDAARLIAIGAPAAEIEVSANLKFDISPSAGTPLLAQLRSALEGESAAPVLVCGSTVEGEEPVVLGAFAEILRRHPAAVMILAPRHPERFTRVAEMAAATGLPVCRRSQWRDQSLRGSILVLDTIGELSSLYALADVAFVGGSLVQRGGHNILEPAQHGVAIVVGPHTENFRDIIGLYRDQQAVVVATIDSFSSVVLELLAASERRKQLGRRAADLLARHAGATQRAARALLDLLDQRSPAQPSSVQSRDRTSRAEI